MSEFKFACPVCGQHITCDSSSSGSTMPCPTCFRQLVVPPMGAASGSTLVLNAAEVSARPAQLPGNGGADAGRQPPAKGFPWVAMVLGLVVCTAGVAGFVLREKMLPSGLRVSRIPTNSPTEVPASGAVSGNTNWTLNLTDAKIPDQPVAGVINGQKFVMQRAAIRGGMLILWQETKWPPEVGMAVEFFARQAEELAGKTIIIEKTRTNAPHLMVRWKGEQKDSVTQEFHDGYAMRVEFGDIAGTQLPGKIYLAAPDDAKSYLAGKFEAQIHRPSASKHNPGN